MTVQHINTLSGNIQYRNLLFNSAFLASRIVRDSSVLLFQREGYYIEIYFDLDGEIIIESRIFESTDELTPYLKEIKLPDFFAA